MYDAMSAWTKSASHVFRGHWEQCFADQRNWNFHKHRPGQGVKLSKDFPCPNGQCRAPEARARRPPRGGRGGNRGAMPADRPNAAHPPPRGARSAGMAGPTCSGSLPEAHGRPGNGVCRSETRTLVPCGFSMGGKLGGLRDGANLAAPGRRTEMASRRREPLRDGDASERRKVAGFSSLPASQLRRVARGHGSRAVRRGGVRAEAGRPWLCGARGSLTYPHSVPYPRNPSAESF